MVIVIVRDWWFYLVMLDFIYICVNVFFVMFIFYRRFLIAFEECVLMIICNRNFFYIKDELLSRKKRERKKKIGSKSVDVLKFGVLEKNERWEYRKIFIIWNCFKVCF